MENSDDHEDNFAGLPPSEPDCSRLTTAARRLTLGRLYETCGGSYTEIAAAVQTMLILEDRVATLHYRWALDLEDKTEAILKRHKKDIEILKHWYLKTGLASGSHEAEEMIRDLAAQGRCQAPNLPPQ
jgi:hypothetical protein